MTSPSPWSVPLAMAPAQISHRRYQPKAHAFASGLTYLYFDPDQMKTWTQGSSLWSATGFNLLCLNEADFLTSALGSIRQKVAACLQAELDVCLDADMPIRVLGLPRMLGIRFNSVVFYFVFDRAFKPQFILTEITNTPWGERHTYVHDCRGQTPRHISDYQQYRFEFAKTFHVSPFMPLDLDYRWHFSFSDQKNVVYMQLWQTGILQFDANMSFALEPITLPSQQRRYALKHLLEPCKMLFGIYSQAFKLWRKKLKFYRHPHKK